jgi:hypothetical protein
LIRERKGVAKDLRVVLRGIRRVKGCHLVRERKGTGK